MSSENAQSSAPLEPLAGRVDADVRRLIFPRGLRTAIANYATGMKTMRQTAGHFAKFGLTREMLKDIFGGRVVVEEGDVDTIVDG